ncbi:hypothetical protein NLI96_g3999 [Meripilus lineatus]|uniref:C2H2-type domain-containing protein n=1 Tax=Meripilus lineatus TaxID=2056292 RepID=A0AAD5V7A9_9APHY|nr:hypothetical protein NLI96_g3999 [Physisporinus lineatus]
MARNKKQQPSKRQTTEATQLIGEFCLKSFAEPLPDCNFSGPPPHPKNERTYCTWVDPDTGVRCQGSVSKPGDLRRHEYTHLKREDRPEKYKCIYMIGDESCSYWGTQSGGLKSHIRSKHTNELIPCDQESCEYLAKSESMLTHHRQDDHQLFREGPQYQGGRRKNIDSITKTGGQPTLPSFSEAFSQFTRPHSPPPMARPHTRPVYLLPRDW